MSSTPIKASSGSLLLENDTPTTVSSNASSGPNPTVLVDIWENQRYKAMGGGWKAPFQLGVPHYSNASGKLTGGPEYLINSRKDVHLESGWTWCGSDWQWDCSGYYGEFDEDGWSYANNFEELFKLTELRKLSAKKHPVTSLVRRRRLIRKRTCKLNSAEGSLYVAQGKWLSLLENSLRNVIHIQSIDVSSVTSYELNRSSSYNIAIPLLDKKLGHILATLGTYKSKLAQLKEFLIDKGTMEQNYSKALFNFSAKWSSGGMANLKSTASESESKISARSRVGLNTGQLTDTSPDVTYAPYTPPAPGFFKVVSVAHEEISDRLGMFATRILNDLVQETDGMDNLVTDALSECASTGKSLKMEVIAGEVQIGAIMKALTQGFAEAKLNADLEIEYFRREWSHEHGRAAVPQRVKGNIKETLSKSSTSFCLANGQRRYFNEINNTPHYDMWYMMQCYRYHVNLTDAKLLMYHAFLNQQLKEVKQLTRKLSQYLKLLAKILAVEQIRSWEEYSDLITSHLGHGYGWGESISPLRGRNSVSGKGIGSTRFSKSTADRHGNSAGSTEANTATEPLEGRGRRNSVGSRGRELQRAALKKVPTCHRGVVMHCFMHYNEPDDSSSSSTTLSISALTSKLKLLRPNLLKGKTSKGIVRPQSSSMSTDRSDGQFSVNKTNEGSHCWTLVRAILTYDGTLYLYKLTQQELDSISVEDCDLSKHAIEHTCIEHGSDPNYKRVVLPLDYTWIAAENPFRIIPIEGAAIGAGLSGNSDLVNSDVTTEESEISNENDVFFEIKPARNSHLDSGVKEAVTSEDKKRGRVLSYANCRMKVADMCQILVDKSENDPYEPHKEVEINNQQDLKKSNSDAETKGFKPTSEVDYLNLTISWMRVLNNTLVEPSCDPPNGGTSSV